MPPWQAVSVVVLVVSMASAAAMSATCSNGMTPLYTMSTASDPGVDSVGTTGSVSWSVDCKKQALSVGAGFGPWANMYGPEFSGPCDAAIDLRCFSGVFQVVLRFVADGYHTSSYFTIQLDSAGYASETVSSAISNEQHANNTQCWPNYQDSLGDAFILSPDCQEAPQTGAIVSTYNTTSNTGYTAYQWASNTTILPSTVMSLSFMPLQGDTPFGLVELLVCANATESPAASCAASGGDDDDDDGGDDDDDNASGGDPPPPVKDDGGVLVVSLVVSLSALAGAVFGLFVVKQLKKRDLRLQQQASTSASTSASSSTPRSSSSSKKAKSRKKPGKKPGASKQKTHPALLASVPALDTTISSTTAVGKKRHADRGSPPSVSAASTMALSAPYDSAESTQLDTAAMERLRILLLRNDCELLEAIVVSASTSLEFDNLASALVNVFMADVARLGELVSWAVRRADHDGSDFSASGFSAKLLHAFVSTVCTPWLQTVLAPTVTAILKRKKVLEVDPAQVKRTPGSRERSNKSGGRSNKSGSTAAAKGNKDSTAAAKGNKDSGSAGRARKSSSNKTDAAVDSIAANATVVTKIVERLITDLLEHIDELPQAVVELAQLLRSTLGDRGRRVLSDVLFVRLVAPAILLPHKVGLADRPLSNQQERSALLVSKVLLAVVSSASQGGVMMKEQFMAVFVDFVAQQSGRMLGLLDKLGASPDPRSRLTERSLSLVSTSVPVVALRKAVSHLYALVDDVAMRIVGAIDERSASEGSTPSEASRGIVVMAECSSVFDALGAIPERQKRLASMAMEQGADRRASMTSVASFLTLSPPRL